MNTATIGKAYINTEIIRITKCSFPLMWYQHKIGHEYEVVRMRKKDLFIPFDVDKFVCKTIESPIEKYPLLEGWILDGDFDVIGTSTREIKKDSD